MTLDAGVKYLGYERCTYHQFGERLRPGLLLLCTSARVTRHITPSNTMDRISAYMGHALTLTLARSHSRTYAARTTVNDPATLRAPRRKIY